jgi:hypothetical protein
VLVEVEVDVEVEVEVDVLVVVLVLVTHQSLSNDDPPDPLIVNDVMHLISISPSSSINVPYPTGIISPEKETAITILSLELMLKPSPSVSPPYASSIQPPWAN